MNTKRVLIITGGKISIEFAKEYLSNQQFDTIIAVDSGMVAAKELDLQVHYIVGDFDSVPKEVLEYYRNIVSKSDSIILKEYNPIKDSTDTHIAIELAMELKPDEIILLGATGSRIDHMLANIHLLYIPLRKKIKAFIIDEHNKIYLLNQDIALNKKELYGSYLSLQPFTEVVSNVTLTGFKYPLDKKDLYIGDSLGVSNEVTEEQANILLQKGILIVIESKD
jgi:thiamine pyrophosphokinase